MYNVIALVEEIAASRFSFYLCRLGETILLPRVFFVTFPNTQAPGSSVAVYSAAQKSSVLTKQKPRGGRESGGGGRGEACE